MNSKIRLILHAGLSAFVIYFCMYAFRKPFAAASFEGISLFGLNYKVALVISQVLGYALSKFIGIKFNSGAGMKNRATYIILFIFLAELALLGFAFAPIQYKFIFLFLNGIPLGMIWGLVFAYIEGRTVTELLAAILSSSFILASGVTKSVGKFLMNEYQISEFLMPFTTGAIFFLPLVIGVWAIEKVPPPNAEDIASRKERTPMTDEDRKAFFKEFAPGFIALIVILFLMTAFRDLRDNFAAEFWDKLGKGDSAAIFTQTEIYIAIGVLALLSFFILLKNNRKAIQVMLLIMFVGLVILLGSTLLYQFTSFNSPLVWMSVSGLGVYMAYTTLGGGLIFERISSLSKRNTNAAFLIYIADAVGYLGSVFILVIKEVIFPDISFLSFFIKMIYILGIFGLSCIIFSYFYFSKKMLRNDLHTRQGK